MKSKTKFLVEAIQTDLNEVKASEEKYMLLDRLRSDCEYFLKNGNRDEKHLWAGNVKDQIEKMKELYNSFKDEDKPEWLSLEDIENYEKQMLTDKVEESEQKEYRYITNHGIGPGTVPDKTYIRSEELKGGKTAIYLNRPLTSEELDKYDIKPEWIQESKEELTEGTENKILSKAFIEVSNEEELDKLVKELLHYNKSIYKQAVDITKEQGSVAFKAKKISDLLFQLDENTEKQTTSEPITESVDWNYYDKFAEITDKYMPDQGEGETLASQIVTAINKLVYKWYNDGDVYDNVNSGMNGWANDLSDYANWLNKYCKPAARILDSIYNCNNNDTYEDILKALADKCLNADYLATMEEPKQGSIYNCEGPYEFSEYSEEDDEDYYDENEEEFDENID